MLKHWAGRQYIIAISIFVLLSSDLSAENYYESGARFAGMSNSAVAMVDFWSITNNQAGIAYLDNTTFGVHHENRYLLSQLGLSSMAVVIPNESATIGAQLSYFGFDKYHETKAGLAVAKKINSKLAVGVQIDYFNTFLYGIEGINRITFETGLLAQIDENVRIGLSLFNPLPSKDINEYNQLPTICRLGVAYNYQGKGFLTAEVEQDLENETILRTGLEYNLNEKFKMRTGVSTGSTRFSFGLGYEFDKLEIDLAFAQQQILGLTPFFSIQYSIQ